ncbi:MAG: GxxExxY protein [Verrucomicrobiales bacterium]|nr:GxxExxY protein [Verrucomicrobiales bacterium]
MPIDYKGVRLDCGYRVDVLVEDTLILELKAVDVLLPIHQAQLLTYLRLSGKQVGILINFNVELLKLGTKRMVARILRALRDLRGESEDRPSTRSAGQRVSGNNGTETSDVVA